MQRAMAIGMAVLLAHAAHAARPWPVLVRTYWSQQAGPAAVFELDRDGRTWRGVPGDVVPGTQLLIRLVSFMPGGVVLCDDDRRLGVPVLVRQSPWYQTPRLIADQEGPIPHADGKPEPPPEPGSAADYAELAREYKFLERWTEAAVCEARAKELGASQTIVSGDVAYRRTDAATDLGPEMKMSIHKGEDDEPKSVAATNPSTGASPADGSPASETPPTPDASAAPGAAPSPAASADPYAPPAGN
jgi:hypothetical protein